jgi:hypothetical protein
VSFSEVDVTGFQKSTFAKVIRKHGNSKGSQIWVELFDAIVGLLDWGWQESNPDSTKHIRTQILWGAALVCTGR